MPIRLESRARPLRDIRRPLAFHSLKDRTVGRAGCHLPLGQLKSLEIIEAAPLAQRTKRRVWSRMIIVKQPCALYHLSRAALNPVG